MEPRPGSASNAGIAEPGVSPFSGPGLLARAGPFALVAVAAEASLALPPGTHQWAGVTVSLVLLAAVGLAFLLPWDRLPGWMAVLVPLAYTGSALALTLAGGTISGVGIVLLIPLIWTALFRRPWESACIVAAIVAAEIVVSVVQSAPDAVIVRRVLLWGALGALLAVATHGLRDRIRRSQETTARLQERVGELMVVQDRERLAADLQSSVVQRIFAGPVDQALPPEATDPLLDMLRLALGLVGTGRAHVCVEAGEYLGVTVTGAGPAAPANGHRDFAPLRERASQDHIAIEIEPTADGTRLAWSLPLNSGPTAG